jgi:hypothetical protein
MAQSSHAAQLDTHTQRSPGWRHDPSSLQRYGVAVPRGTHTPGPQSSQLGQLALQAQTLSSPHSAPGLSHRQAWSTHV